MKPNRQFVIPFKGLKVGKHDFAFDIDGSFFEEFEGSEITKAEVHVDVVLDKKTTMMELRFDLTGTVNLPCDRCLDDLELEIDYTPVLFVNFGEETEEQSDELLVLSHNEYELDIAQMLYEYVNLSLPYKRVHPDDEDGYSTCNEEMLENLEKHIVRENEIDIDPRWNDLKNLLNNN